MDNALTAPLDRDIYLFERCGPSIAPGGSPKPIRIKVLMSRASILVSVHGRSVLAYRVHPWWMARFVPSGVYPYPVMAGGGLRGL